VSDALLHVAAAVILRPDGQVLLAQRPAGKAYAGYWEFPGGKLEPGETPREALDRELAEELGLTVRHAAPWLVQQYRYPHAHVLLHFFRVFEWDGDPVGHDGQAFAWQTPGRFDVAPLLPANTAVLRALLLPPVYGISMADEIGEAAFLARAKAALRWLQRHLLGNPAGTFSVQKFFDTLKSQGLPVGKNTLHDYLAHLEDAFLVRTVSLHTASERQRMVNPRKAYPIDPGLISLYERTGRVNLGHALETAVFLELERRGCETDYVRTRDSYEVDFFARNPEGDATLIQVCTDVSDPSTYEREVRALSAAAAEHRGALPLLITFDTLPPRSPLPKLLRWQPAIAWLLGDELPGNPR